MEAHVQDGLLTSGGWHTRATIVHIVIGLYSPGVFESADLGISVVTPDLKCDEGVDVSNHKLKCDTSPSGFALFKSRNVIPSPPSELS